jgi:hypothetical protein
VNSVLRADAFDLTMNSSLVDDHHKEDKLELANLILWDLRQKSSVKAESSRTNDTGSCAAIT